MNRELNSPGEMGEGDGTPALDRDVLISRIIDGEASPEDWAAFKALASREASVWRDLAECQQDHADLSTAVAEASAIADSIDLPVEEARSVRLGQRLRMAVGWGGWVAAAAVALAFSTGTGTGGSGEGSAASLIPTGAIPVSTPEQAYDAYLRLGRAQDRVVEEVPARILIETRPLQSGGFQVRYIRQIVEQVNVPTLYEFGEDEAGRPVPIRVRHRVVEPPL